LFFVATKADDDDGLPHTLEHLIFLGSEEYPYKGVLDILANKCYASGTNAWTGNFDDGVEWGINYDRKLRFIIIVLCSLFD
jgi:hypothetical protein